MKNDFHSRVAPANERGCTLWTGSVDKDGYGLFWFNKRLVRAHRHAYQSAAGQEPGPLFVLHRCDTPGCVNPDHLFLGTAADNAKDRNDKKRQASGEAFPVGAGRRVVTEAMVREIRASTERECDLVRRLGLDQATVNHIRHRRSWGHVE